jgi:hypothetical protein
MPATSPLLTRATGLLAGVVLVLSGVRAAETDSATDKDAFPIFDNSITLSGQNAWVSKDKAAFQADTRNSGGLSGGIEDFRFEKDPTKDVSIQTDGHALAGAEDYLAHFNISKDEVGSFDAGYKRFRTFYDGIGGFFPSNNAWMPLPEQDLHIDRAKFWIEGTVNLPDKPVFTLRYTNELRDGRKDTTIWGDTDFTGIPIQSNSNLATRKIIPAYIDLGERHEAIEASVKHTVGKTTFELSLIDDLVDNLDTRYLNRFPGEVKPFPAIPATPVTVVPAARANNAIAGFDQEGINSNTFSVTAKTETVFSERFAFHTGLSYQHLTSDFTGNRILDTSTPTAVGVVTAPSANFQNLAGGSKVIAYTGTAGVDLKPAGDFTVRLDLKGDNRYTKGADSFMSVAAAVNTATGAIATTPTANHANSRNNEMAWTPAIDARYTGFRNIALYASADYRYVSGEDRTTPQFTLTPVTENADVHENHGNYTIGANWVPCQFFSLRGETFYKDHQNNFQDYASSAPAQYVLGYQLYGGKLTATLSPLPTLSFTTSYILETGTMQTATETFAQYDSMDTKSHHISETINWNPTRQFYMQGNLNVVFDTTHTAYPQAGTLADNVLRNADNNYWDGSVLAGYALDKKTDGEAECTYYRANNYQPAFTGSVPYGAGAIEYRATVGLKHKINDHLIASAKIGYLVSRNDTTGDFTDYTARVAYVSLDHEF